MPNLGMPELMVIAVIALVIFGGGKLAKTLGDLGRGVGEFRRGVADLDDAAEKRLDV